MKNIRYIFIIAIVVTLAWLFIPKSCEPVGKLEQLQQKSDNSLLIDSLQSLITKRVYADNEVKVNIFKDSIKKANAEKEAISSKYYALRASVSKHRAVRIDSFTQIVEVPVIDYNASINSGNLCDSLIMYQDTELALKDSIISCREIQIQALFKQVETGEITKSDLIALIEVLKKDLKKCKDQNKGLKIALLIDTLLHFAH